MSRAFADCLEELCESRVGLALGTHRNVVRNCEFYNTPVDIKIKGQR